MNEILGALGIAAILICGTATINLHEDNQQLQIQNQALQAEIRGLRDGVNMSRD